MLSYEDTSLPVEYSDSQSEYASYDDEVPTTLAYLRLCSFFNCQFMFLHTPCTFSNNFQFIRRARKSSGIKLFEVHAQF